MVSYGLRSPQTCFCLPINRWSALWSTTAIPMWFWAISVRARLSSLIPKSQLPNEPISPQRRSTPSTLSQMVSTCGSSYAVIDMPLLRDLTNPTRSWEFFTNLDYEFDIIRGRRPYRWTIWVRNSGLCFRASHPRLCLGLNSRLCRFTPLPAWLPLQWWSSTWFTLTPRVQLSAR